MNSTVAKTYRMSSGVHALVVSEAERLKTTEADIVRLALREYFDDRQEQDRLQALEQRITTRIDSHCQRLSAAVQQILTLAQPE